MEDLRKTGLKNGLRQLTTVELERVLSYPGEMVLDAVNYADGRYCPLAIGLELDMILPRPTHDTVFETLTQMGYRVYNTRGISGDFYTSQRREDLITAVKEVLSERV